MLSNLKNVFKVTDLRNKILFVMADDRPVPARRRHPRARHRPRRRQAVQEGCRVAGRARLPRPVLRRRLRQLLDLRARHHAVHHGQHHHAGARRGHPQAREAAARRRGRAAQDHAVHALPGHRHRPDAGHGADVHLRQRQRQRLLRRGATIAQNVKLLPDGMWPRGYLVILTLVAGTARADVDRRADQPARHRQRHEHDHLRRRWSAACRSATTPILQERSGSPSCCS